MTYFYLLIHKNCTLSVKDLGLTLSQKTYSLIAYPVSKRLSTLLRHGDLPQEENGAIEFWRFNDYLRNEFERFSIFGLMKMWKSTLAKGGGNKKRFQHCTDPIRTQKILTSELFKVIRSGRNPIDPSSQDIVLIPNNFFEYIYHFGCAINLHSITNSGLIPGGTKFVQGKTDGILYTTVNPMNKDHRDPQDA